MTFRHQDCCVRHPVVAELPIHSIEEAIRVAVEGGPVVVSAATGSGKSTEVPRWCPRPVVIVEPRRVACRALAARVAELEGTTLGSRVGYVVRDEAKVGSASELVFVTPGVALRALDRYLGFETFILDELHERTLEIDLLLALVRPRAKRLVVMSATIDAQVVADRLGGQALFAPGRTYPVDITYDDSGPTVPTPDDLDRRVARAVAKLDQEAGDALVFLPGKAEIARARSRLSGLRDRLILELHGSMSPEDQASVFRPSERPKVVLSTNVAETSVTVPGVRTVIDAGLVRQVRYHHERSTLTLVPIARDSADQRAGRAGRTAPGRCLRLWRKNAHLDASTPPEIHRTSLVPLVLAAKAHGQDPEALPWLDPPKAHAIEAATSELSALGAIDERGHLTQRGRALFRLPIDPWVGRVLLEAEQAGLLDDAIDLAAALELSRPLFFGKDERDPRAGRAPRSASDRAEPAANGAALEEEDPRSAGCDLIAFVQAVRGTGAPWVHRAAREEALLHRERLRRVFSRTGPAPGHTAPIEREALVRAILRADPRAARVARVRGKRVAWSGPGTEMELDPRSAVTLRSREPTSGLPDAIAVLGLRSLREGTKTRVIATAAAPVSLSLLDRLGLGTPRVGSVRLHRGRVVAEVERVYGGRVLAAEETSPEGSLLREAVATLVAEGRLFPGAKSIIESRLEEARLAQRLGQAGLIRADTKELEALFSESHDARDFLLRQLALLGLERADEVELLDAEDLFPPALPPHLQDALDRDYPRRVDLGEAQYRVRYDLAARRAVLLLESGGRHVAPPRRYLPRFPGLKISIQAGGTTVDLG